MGVEHWTVGDDSSSSGSSSSSSSSGKSNQRRGQALVVFNVCVDYFSLLLLLNPVPLIMTCLMNRCGTTLLHQVMICAGVCSLSEPFWFDQLCRLRSQYPSIERRRLLRLCCAIDFQLSRQNWFPNAINLALNPHALGHRVMDLAIREFPEARHIFMYRDVINVVEDYQSITYYNSSWFSRPYLILFGTGPVTWEDFTSYTLR